MTVTAMTQPPATFSAGRFRDVLGLYPTGVVAVTALGPEAEPVGMIVGTFGSVSLDPPLVSFMPGKASASWGRLAPQARYCINVLGQHQAALCQALASKRADKFAGIRWALTPEGAPALADCLAWIDCQRESLVDAGDHHIVLCRVTGLRTGAAEAPLLFHRGGLGTFRAAGA